MSSISNNKYELRIRTRLVTHVERLNVRREVWAEEKAKQKQQRQLAQKNV